MGMMNMLLMMTLLLLTPMLLQLMMPMVLLLMMPMVPQLVMTTLMMMSMLLTMMKLLLMLMMLLFMKPAERLVVDFHLVDVEDVPDLCPTAEDLPEDLTDALPDPHREVLHRREDVDVDSPPSLLLTVAPLETGCWLNRLPAPREVKQDCKLSVG